MTKLFAAPFLAILALTSVALADSGDSRPLDLMPIRSSAEMAASASVGGMSPTSSATAMTLKTETVWNGGANLLADVAATTAIAGGALASFDCAWDHGDESDCSGSIAVLTLGVAGHFLASPIVHMSRGNAGKGMASLGLRAGAATAGVVLAENGGGAAGLLLPSLAAMTFDWLYLGREERTVSVPAVMPSMNVSSSGTPTFGLTITR